VQVISSNAKQTLQLLIVMGNLLLQET